ncbi:MAG: hypothetical protein WDW38_000414 [Sanguina aurantia]
MPWLVCRARLNSVVAVPTSIGERYEAARRVAAAFELRQVAAPLPQPGAAVMNNRNSSNQPTIAARTKTTLPTSPTPATTTPVSTPAAAVAAAATAAAAAAAESTFPTPTSTAITIISTPTAVSAAAACAVPEWRIRIHQARRHAALVVRTVIRLKEGLKHPTRLRRILSFSHMIPLGLKQDSHQFQEEQGRFLALRQELECAQIISSGRPCGHTLANRGGFDNICRGGLRTHTASSDQHHA